MTAPIIQTAPSCPDGHVAMVLNSCAAYPACRRSSPVLLNVACPWCQAALVVRASRKTGNRFTGCSSWPACPWQGRPQLVHACGSAVGPEGERAAAPLTTPDPAIGGGDADDVRSSAPDLWALRRELGRLEDRAAATGWAWDAEVSRRVDCLLVLIEGARA